MNPDRKSFQNYVSAEEPRELTRFGRMATQLNFAWNENEGGYTVSSFSGVELRCRPDPKQINPVTRKPIPPEHLPIHRYPSTATPSFYVPPPVIKTEDDVIYRPNLPSFENQEGQVLNQRDSELLISFMTVPYMRIPLILSFFASDDRIHKLQSAELRLILDSVLFEPGKYLRMDMSHVEPTMVPTPHADLLASPHGLLLNELCRSPDSTINSILSLLKGALACDTGSVVDEDGEGFNTSTIIILYASRLGARLDNYLSFLISNFGGNGLRSTNWPLRGLDILDLEKLKKGLVDLRVILASQFNTLFEDYLHRLHVESVGDPTNETLVDRNSRLACDLHSHKLLLFRNYETEEFSEVVADTLLGSTIFLTTRHTWNKTTKDGPVLQIPETELYEIVHYTRRKLITWLAGCKQGILDHVMQTALQVSSSITGSFKVSAATMDNQNRWSRIRGDRSIGRWAVGSTRTTITEATSSDDLSKARDQFSLKRQISIDNDVGEVVDNGMLGVEIDVQVGQLTLRSKHLSALKSDVANHPDVIAIFGDATIQASLINSAENCDYYRLVGLNHEIAYWKTPHTACHPLDDEWERDYDPAELADTETWIVGLFEPIRKNFFNGAQPPAMQFLMTSKPAPKDAEVIILLGLNQNLGGPFKLVYLFKKLKCVHVYECVSQGRNWWYSLHLTTDYRYCLRDMQPSDRQRNTQYPEWWIRASGSPYPMGVNDYLSNDINGVSRLPANSVMIYRDQQHHLNLSGGRETLIPSRLLYGAVPDSLLESYVFWEDESVLPPGCDFASFPQGIRSYQRLRGYPKSTDSEYMIFVEFIYIGSWENELSSTNTVQQRSNVLFDATGFPGRSVRITKRPIALIRQNFEAKQRIAAHLESLKLLATPKRTKKVKVEAENSAMEENLFKIDAWVECDYEGNSNYWPCIVRRVNDDGTYDLEFVKEYKWLGIQRLINAKTVQARGESEKKKRGEGVWHWEGMSASEDDDWKEESDEEENKDDDEEDKTQKARLPFNFFDKLDILLEASNRKVEVCIALLDEVRKFHPHFTDVAALSREMRRVAESNPILIELYDMGDLINKEDEKDLLFLNLLYAPHASRLHSLMKVLCRIENLSFICPWTKKYAGSGTAEAFNLIERKCPPLDLIELPRLKLSFTAKLDHEGEYRLYSVDHVDLFISNERIPSYGKMLRGIPHSLIMSNVRGESQILVPVVPVSRPFIGDEPFSTFIVLDRSNMPPAERFFLYPIHVSFSFLMTKGVNSALYLMLLKLLHREYSEVFRLSDSIATDTAFNTEGLLIYNNFASANDDRHPDAHACRLKVTLMTIDSGMDLPWDITLEAARYVAKLLRISSDCRIPIREELQILESDQIVLSSESTLHKPDDHDEYSMALCFNRKHYLKAILTNSELDKVPFILPPRALTSNWPYYQDNTVFGETYQGMREITSVEGEGSWESEKIGVDETDAPEKGWLVVAVFHTLWSSNCIKTMPFLHDLVPMYQNIVNFVSIKADGNGMMSVAKSMNVNAFPTIVVLRGGKEIQRLEGSEKVVEKLIRLLAVHITEEDKAAKAKYRYRLKMQQALEAGIEFVEPEEDTKPVGQIDWTFDPEQCGPSMQIEEDGMKVIGQDQNEDEDEVIWEHRDYGSNSYMWKPFTKETMKEIEKNYKTGKLYSSGYMYLSEVELYVNTVKITDYEVSGFTGTSLPSYSDIEIRRWGTRCPVPNEEDYLTKEQKERDKKTAEWREKMEAYKKKLKEEKVGKDIEAIRGTVGFLPNTGIHTWSCIWNHEPTRSGTSDGVGICSELKEDFTATSTPNLGGAQDAGYSLCLYADGSLYHNGKLLMTVSGTRIDKVEEIMIHQESANSVVPAEEAKTEVEVVAPAVTVETEGNVDPEKIEEKFQVATAVKAPLFGRKSKITCEFNTEEDGGVLNFKINDVLLSDIVLKGVFKLLGGSEVFPCLCFAPLDEALVESRKLAQKQKFEKMKEEAENNKKKDEDGENGEENEDQPEETDEGKKDEEQKRTLESAVLLPEEEELFDMFPSVSLVLDSSDSSDGVVEPAVVPEAVPEINPLEEGKLKEPTNDTITPAVEGEAPSEPSEETKAEENKEEGEVGPVDTAAAAPLETAEIPLDKVRWMFEDPELGWNEYSLENSAGLESATRESINKLSVMHGKEKHTCRLDQMMMTSEKDSGKDCRLRRYVLTDGVESLWEMLSMKFEKPHGLTGQGVLKLFEKVWRGNESMKGNECSLGFIFLYNLFTGESNCKVIGSSYGSSGNGFGGFGGFGGYGGPSMGPSSFSFGGKGKATTNDSHRFAVLLGQLYTDRNKKSLPGSVINVLSRNRQVALKMPKFKDTRKSSRTPFFNGWVDDQEPASPVGDLFRKLVPVMHTLKKKAAFHFPPPPPFPELPTPPSTTTISVEDAQVSLSMDVPSLTDYGCEERVVPAFSTEKLDVMIADSTFNRSKQLHRNNTVLLVEDERTMNQLLQNNPNKLFIIDFFANWCGPCKALAPVLHSLAVSIPTAIFVKIDVEENEELSARFSIKSMPTILFLRGSEFTPEYVLANIQGGGAAFMQKFLAILQKVSTKEEWILLEKYQSNSWEDQDPSELYHLSLSEEDLDTLATEPLASCKFCFQSKSREELGVSPINSELAFDLNAHSAAQTAPAKAVLSRFKDDMKAFAEFTNESPVFCMISLGLDVIKEFFSGNAEARQQIEFAHVSSKELLIKLQELKSMDNKMIQDAVPLLTHAANFINLENARSDDESVRKNKVRYLLNRIAGQRSIVWIEFLFGILISTKGEEDLRNLNPFLSKDMVRSIFSLVTLTMMRANRLGHTNRCIGMAINLEKMLETLLSMKPIDLKCKEEVLTPKLTQLVEELGKNITMGRYYMNKTVNNGEVGYAFDPRYLVFEFVWNIQLRKKQVSIINDFRNSLQNGNSKVKQMIMGAGKTSVVAPLLALIVADGKSLVLSVVPKALVEMSRTRLRETFASIMVKRVYTLEFERSTIVKPSMSKSLENAVINRGVVVATPTTLKSIMLSYVEVLQHLADAEKTGLKAKIAEKKQQAEELAKILKLFREGIMLLDEVDLILHPLKSELNFPIGEKFDLDGSEDGERWDLPIHLFDAFLYFTTAKVTAFEQRGIALDILKKISNVIQKGIDERHLQRLPHIILLNPDFYDEYLKPLLAEWAYLWLQKQHLHGIDHMEAIRYMLEGGAAKSDTSIKVHLLELELNKTQITLGKLSPLVTPTTGYQKMMSPEKRSQFERKQISLKRQNSDTIQSDPSLFLLREAEESTITNYLHVSRTHCKLVSYKFVVSSTLFY